MSLRICSKCGSALRSHGKATKLCIACYRVARSICESCGTELPQYSRAKKCRECWKARGSGELHIRRNQNRRPPVLRLCERCASPLSTKSRPETSLCSLCYRKRLEPQRYNPCKDCGKRRGRGSRPGRCWTCWSKFRNPHGSTCTHKGCSRSHFGKGLCRMHYLSQRDRTHRMGRGRLAKSWIASHPCQVCGYDRLPSEVARIIPGTNGGRYEIGNMLALCALHHREMDAGLIKPPAPLLYE